jgi:hypothetical protein
MPKGKGECSMMGTKAAEENIVTSASGPCAACMGKPLLVKFEFLFCR